MTAPLTATGFVVSREPLVTATSDLRNHELVLTTHVDFYGSGGFEALTFDIRIPSDKLADLIRFASLAQGHGDAR